MNIVRTDSYVRQLSSGAKIIVHNRDKAKIHSYVSPEKSFGNATHIIESSNYLTIIDTQYTIKYSKEFRLYADTLDKPIAGVIISHSHPDHYFGLTSAFSDVPSYALKETIEDIRLKGPDMIKESKKEMKNMVPDYATVPNNLLNGNETVHIDGIKYIYKKYEKAEADVQLVIELPGLNVIIVQDLVYNGYHPWLGHSIDHWIHLLDDFKYKNKEQLVLVGHGVPCSSTIYNNIKQYLINAKSIMTKSKGDKILIEKRLIEEYPNYKGRMIIPMWLNYI